MTFIDTHTHPYDEAFDADREAMVARAQAAGVALMLLPATAPGEYGRQAALAETCPALFRQMMGLHPTEVGAHYAQQLAQAHALLFAHPDRYVAVGEIGLDYYWDRSGTAWQKEALRTQLLWARQLCKPVSLHLRSAKDGSADAYEDFFEMNADGTESAEPLELSGNAEGAAWRGVLHCFSGSVAQARRGVAQGFALGIGGVVTYKHSVMAQVVAAMPLECLVLETDAPYLAPVPHRGQRNESAYLVEVALCVAALKGLPVETVAAVTTATARRIFKL